LLYCEIVGSCAHFIIFSISVIIPKFKVSVKIYFLGGV
jgi:hypothetical protein